MFRYYLADVVRLLFSFYTMLLFVRIILSWFPNLHHKTWVRFIAFYTDPFLNVFRRILPPLGGVLDLSPLLAFFALKIIQMIVLRLILL